MVKVLRITTVPISLNILLKGQLRFMKENGFEVITASANGPEVDDLVSREGISHYMLNFTRTISPFRDIMVLFQTIRLIKKIKPQIVHTHTPKAGLIGMIAAKVCRVPVRMHTVAGMPLMEVTGFRKTILRFAESMTYSCAHNVYPNSKYLAKWIKANFKGHFDKISVIADGSSNGINSSFFKLSVKISDQAASLRMELGVKSDAILYIFIGRLVKDKGLEELVNAFLDLNKNNPKSHLVLVGNYENQREPVSNDIKERIRSSDKIHAVGFQEDIRPYLAMSDIFVFPSYREGFPNVVMQALCFNLPCIVTDINGCNELISEGENGLLVEPKSVVSLLNSMEILLKNTGLRKKLSNNIRDKIVETYDQKIVWQAILKEYKRLLSLHDVQKSS